jgi:hypothetical protein
MGIFKPGPKNASAQYHSGKVSWYQGVKQRTAINKKSKIRFKKHGAHNKFGEPVEIDGK